MENFWIVAFSSGHLPSADSIAVPHSHPQSRDDHHRHGHWDLFRSPQTRWRLFRPSECQIHGPYLLDFLCCCYCFPVCEQPIYMYASCRHHEHSNQIYPKSLLDGRHLLFAFWRRNSKRGREVRTRQGYSVLPVDAIYSGRPGFTVLHAIGFMACFQSKGRCRCRHHRQHRERAGQGSWQLRVSSGQN